MVTGRELLDRWVKEPMRVWLWNLEDPRDELERRIHASCMLHRIDPEDVGDRLFVDTGRERELCIAKSDRHGSHILQPVVDDLIEEMLARDIDVLIVDPFVSSHQVGENDNGAMDMVAKQWSQVADRTNAAIALVHHTKKQAPGSDISADSGRGASSLVAAARDVRALNRMTKEEAVKAGLENHRSYFRVYSDKANLAPPAEKSDWYKLENVILANHDAVGVVMKWEWPEKATTEVTTDDIRKIQDRIGGNRGYRLDVRTRDAWVGIPIADVLGLDVENTLEREKIKSLIKQGIMDGWLKKESIPDEKRRPREHVVVGNPV